MMNSEDLVHGEYYRSTNEDRDYRFVGMSKSNRAICEYTCLSNIAAAYYVNCEDLEPLPKPKIKMYAYFMQKPKSQTDTEYFTPTYNTSASCFGVRLPHLDFDFDDE